MANEFTPGPWNHDEAFPTSVWANDIWIASTNVETVRTLKEKTANARLIAAAPELLSALKMVDEQAALDFSNKQIAQIQAAIAKAEGK